MKIDWLEIKCWVTWKIQPLLCRIGHHMRTNVGEHANGSGCCLRCWVDT